MTDELAACPCGKTPNGLSIAGDGQVGKWALVYGDCCGAWHIEFLTNYHDLDSQECKRLAREAWNAAPRAVSPAPTFEGERK